MLLIVFLFLLEHSQLIINLARVGQVEGSVIVLSVCLSTKFQRTYEH